MLKVMEMHEWSKIGRAAAVVVICVCVGGVIGWFVGRQGDASPVNLPTNPIPVLALQPAPLPTNADSTAISDLRAPDAAAKSPPSAPPKGWEDKLDDILLANENENAKADHILQLMPTAPPEAQVELAQHLCNMVQDDHYDGAAQVLTNSTTPVDVSTVLLNDLLNRNNNLKLPMLLAVARSDDHPLKGQARDMLELFIQQDFGTNWDQWSTSIDTWLQQQQQQQTQP
jgi:hypothetical protein